MIIAVGVVCLAAGVAMGWLVARLRGSSAAGGRQTDHWKAAADAVPYSASPDEFAVALRNILDQHTDLTLLAVYAGQGDDESLWAFWRDESARNDGMPAAAPATLM